MSKKMPFPSPLSPSLHTAIHCGGGMGSDFPKEGGGEAGHFRVARHITQSGWVGLRIMAVVGYDCGNGS